MTANEFVVNNSITLKLEGGKTNLYINGKLYIHCKHLILNIPINEIEVLEDIESIEEAVEKLKSTEELEWELKYNLSPEEEFFGHCSNLQVWAENGYDSRTLHYSLSFNLLKELADKDPKARLILKEEVAKRLKSGPQSVADYLYETELIHLLPYEMLLEDIVVPEDLKILQEVELEIGEHFYFDIHYLDGFFGDSCINPMNFFDVKSKHLSYLRFESPGIHIIPDAVCKFKHLKHIDFADFGIITHLPKHLECVEIFDVKNMEKISAY